MPPVARSGCGTAFSFGAPLPPLRRALPGRGDAVGVVGEAGDTGTRAAPPLPRREKGGGELIASVHCRAAVFTFGLYLANRFRSKAPKLRAPSLHHSRSLLNSSIGFGLLLLIGLRRFRKARYQRDWRCFQHHGCLSTREGRRLGGGWLGEPNGGGVDSGKCGLEKVRAPYEKSRNRRVWCGERVCS